MMLDKPAIDSYSRCTRGRQLQVGSILPMTLVSSFWRLVVRAFPAPSWLFWMEIREGGEMLRREVRYAIYQCAYPTQWAPNTVSAFSPNNDRLYEDLGFELIRSPSSASRGNEHPQTPNVSWLFDYIRWRKEYQTHDRVKTYSELFKVFWRSNSFLHSYY